MGRIIGRIPWWLPYVLGAFAVLNVMIWSILIEGDPDTFVLVFLGVVALGWMGMAIAWERMAKASVKGSQLLFVEYQHFTEYIKGTNEIISESFKELSQHDLERTIELAHQFNALSAKSVYDMYWREDQVEQE